MANVIARAGRPAIVFAPNKTLAAQLYAEFREFFPQNAVEYFVSYYDYYQPEAYVPQRDLFIEKDSSINEHIEQMRLSCTKSLMERRDVVIVATVSAIYGIGNPNEYHKMILTLRAKDKVAQRDVIARLIQMQYTRNEMDFARGTFRVRGDTIDIFPAEHAELAIRVEMFDDEIESLQLFDPLTGKVRQKIPRFTVYPGSHYVTPRSHRAARHRLDQGRAARPPRILPPAGQAAGRAAPRAAHPLRPRDAGRSRLHQGHRELLAPPVRRHAGRTAADADRLPAEGRADVHGRVARDDRPAQRHVQRRPFAQDQPGRLRLPPALGAGQPAAEVRGIREQDAPDVFSSRPRRPTTKSSKADNVVEQVVRPTGLVDPQVIVQAGALAGGRPDGRDHTTASPRTSACW